MKSKLIQAHAEERKEIFNRSLGVYFNGEDNMYPLLVENLIEASPTAGQCSWLYESFLGGGGFERDFSDVDLSEGDFYMYNPNDLLMDVAESISKHQGVWVHVNYNALYQKEDFSVLPYGQCRLGKKDDKDYHGKVVISQKGWGRSLKKEDVEVIDVYNPRHEVIQAQVDAAGGWENYKGQVIFFSFQPKKMYPTSLIESVYLFADTEYQMGLFFNATSRRGFNDATIIRHKKFENSQDERDFEGNLKGLMGMENSSSVMTQEDDWDSDNQEGGIKIDTIKSDIKPDKYAHFETASSNYIRKAYKNIPPQLVDYVAGKLGNTSGEDLRKAQAVYNSLIARDRLKLERLFSILFDDYKNDINPEGNWKIKQYSLLDDGTAGEETVNSVDFDEKIKEARATLRGSVGGVTAVLNIQKSVAEGVTERPAGLTMLQEIFGFSAEVAEKILGEPKQIDDGTTNQ